MSASLPGISTWACWRAAFVGLVMGLMMAFVSVTLQATQGISGIGLHSVWAGSFDAALQNCYAALSSRSPVFNRSGSLPGGDSLSWRGALQSQYPGILCLSPGTGGELCAQQDHIRLVRAGCRAKPRISGFFGCECDFIRYTTVSIGGIMAGIAGASLSLALINLFQENMTSGIGFIAVAWFILGVGVHGVCWLALCCSAWSTHCSCGSRCLDPHPLGYRGHDAIRADNSRPGVCS
jgi:general nucleoside transport system permease protein